MVFYDVLWCFMMFYVLGAFLVSFCQSVPPELSSNFCHYHQDIEGVLILLKFRSCQDDRHHNVDGKFGRQEELHARITNSHAIYSSSHTHCAQTMHAVATISWRHNKVSCSHSTKCISGLPELWNTSSSPQIPASPSQLPPTHMSENSLVYECPPISLFLPCQKKTPPPPTNIPFK